MLANGLLDEVRALRARGDLHPDLPSMRCVGYRQAWEYLDAQDEQDKHDPRGANGSAQRAGFTALRDKGVFATRQLAKRQITWLRSLPARRIVACDDPTALQQVLALADALLRKP